MNKFIALIFSNIILYTMADAQDGFVLKGRITGYEDSTRIIINRLLSYSQPDLANEKTLYLLNQEFSFHDNIKNPTQYSIRIRPKDGADEDFTAYENLSFWAEAKYMTLTADKGNIAFADISGSELQDQYEAYMNLGREMKKENKQIADSVRMHPDMAEKTRAAMRTRFQRNNEAIEKASIAFIYEHPKYYFALSELAFRIKYYATALNKNKVISFYEQLSREHQQNEYGLMVRTYIQNTASLNSPAVKDKPHPFELHDASGTSVSLASLKGKVVLLDFWFAGCAPCRQEHKTYLKAYTNYRQKGFEILSVNIDANRALWTSAMQQDSMIWKSVWDEERKITEDLYHISGYPSNFLIDAKGVIVAKDLRGEALLERLRKMLEKG